MPAGSVPRQVRPCAMGASPDSASKSSAGALLDSSVLPLYETNEHPARVDRSSDCALASRSSPAPDLAQGLFGEHPHAILRPLRTIVTRAGPRGSVSACLGFFFQSCKFANYPENISFAEKTLDFMHIITPQPCIICK